MLQGWRCCKSGLDCARLGGTGTSGREQSPTAEAEGVVWQSSNGTLSQQLSYTPISLTHSYTTVATTTTRMHDSERCTMEQSTIASIVQLTHHSLTIHNCHYRGVCVHSHSTSYQALSHRRKSMPSKAKSKAKAKASKLASMQTENQARGHAYTLTFSLISKLH